MVNTLPPLALPFDLRGVQQLRRKFTGWAAETYSSGGYPAREMDALREAGLLHVTLPGEPLDHRHDNTAALLQLLQQIGQGNLAVGRIYEGHVNALQLINIYGTEAQRERWYADARNGHLFGVWNTEMRDGIHLRQQADGSVRVVGSKSFCSGSVHVTRPIITGVLSAKASRKALGWQMVVLELDAYSPPIDESFWTPLGMRNSVSFKIDFTGILLAPQDLLGTTGDYNRQPYLSGGAIRFAAVQLGGAAAVLEALRQYLTELKRTDDPYHRTRVARMVMMVESGTLWLQRGGYVNDHSSDPQEVVNYANMVRSAITEYCTECLRLAEHSVGARGMLHPYPFARLHTDLTMYLRQPAPDFALESVGKHYLNDTPSH